MDDILFAMLVLFLLVMLPVLVFILIRSLKNHSQRQDNLARIDQAVGGAVVDDKICEATADGLVYRYEFWPGSRGKPAYFRVFVTRPAHGVFKVVKESGFDRFCKNIGIAKEVQTGDDAFDRAFYILSPANNFCTAYFGEPARRDLVREIFDAGFTELSHDGQTIEARWPNRRPDDTFDPELLPATARRLAALADNLPATAPEESVLMATSLRLGMMAFSIALGVFFFFVMIAAPYPPLDDTSMFARSLLFSIPALTLFLWCAIWVLRGRSSSHIELWTIALISLFTFPLGGQALTQLTNGLLDSGEATTHAVTVLSTETRRHRRSTTYYATLQSWRPGERSISVKISSADHSRISPNRFRADVVTRPGFWGFEWIVSTQFVQAPPKRPLVRFST